MIGWSTCTGSTLVVGVWTSGWVAGSVVVGCATATCWATGATIGCCTVHGWISHAGWATVTDCWISLLGVWIVGFAVLTSHCAISLWFACSNILSCNDGSLLTLKERNNRHNQSSTVDIQIQIQTIALASSLSENAITKNNIINNIHKARIHRQNFCCSLFERL